jgi:diphthamide biosynthesis methyltransferase
MSKKTKLNEKFNKSEISKIKSIVKKEIDLMKRKDLEKEIKKVVSRHLEKCSLSDIDKNFDQILEDIFKNMMQKYHEMFYRQKDIIKNRLKL